MDPEFVRKFSFSANVHACSTNTVSDLYELQREHNSHFHLQKPTFFLLYTKPGICFHPKDSALTPNLPLKEKKKHSKQGACSNRQHHSKGGTTGFCPWKFSRCNWTNPWATCWEFRGGSALSSQLGCTAPWSPSQPKLWCYADILH